MGIGDNAQYHDLQNNFLGIALHDESHPSLALVSVAIYCCVAERLGLDAQPCAFPLHPLAIINPPAGCAMDGQNMPPGSAAAPPMYMDPFRSSREVYLENLQAQLQAMGISAEDSPDLLNASPTVEIVRRTANSIIASLQAIRRNHAVTPSAAVHSFPDMEGAFYASVWALVLLPEGSDIAAGVQRRNCLGHLTKLMEKHSLTDTWLIEEYILPLIEDHAQYEQLHETIRVIRTSDHMPKQVKNRTLDACNNVRYKVGQVFQHKRYSYKAVIIGWDVECTATEDWMAHMGVYYLPRGKYQSFYHVL